ncbi:MAG: hypothetical protein AAF790_00105 [Planctomycetota bacterium]
MLDKTAQLWRRFLARRFRRRPLLPFLLAATLAVGSAVFGNKPDLAAWSTHGAAWPAFVFALLGFVFGVQGLLAIWLLSARRGWLPRSVLAAGYLPLMGWYIADDRPLAQWITFCAALFCGQVLWVAATRVMTRNRRSRNALAPPVFRFKVATVLVLMIVLACILAAARGASWLLLGYGVLPWLLAVELYFPAVLLLIVSLGGRSARLAAVVLLIALAGYTAALSLIFDEGWFPINALCWNLSQAGVTLVWLLGVRSKARRGANLLDLATVQKPPPGPPPKLHQPEDAEPNDDGAGTAEAAGPIDLHA